MQKDTSQIMSVQSDDSEKKRPWYKTLLRRDANVFVKAARVLLLAYGSVVGVEAILPHALDSRPLHDNEIKALEDMGYKSSIDYEDIRVYASENADVILDIAGMAAMTKGNLIVVDTDMYHDDFTQANSIDEALFVHEVGHVWQNQNYVTLSRVHAFKEIFAYHALGHDGVSYYEYELDENKDLTDYGLEQQPTIIADFYIQSKKGDFQPDLIPGLLNAENMSPDVLKEKYEAVLSNFLENPKYARFDAFKP